MPHIRPLFYYIFIMRLDKFLANARIGTRKEVKNILRTGAVTVNGITVTDAGFHVAPEEDTVTVNGSVVGYQEHRYYMLNKPSGVISATQDAREKTVLDLLLPDDRKNIFPVGRLDKDTTGLLILTDDGELAHRLLSPKKHVKKKYLATLDAAVGQREADLFAKGLRVDDDFTAMPAILEIPSEKEVYVTIEEGKYHQVKRMFESVGRQVVSLKRVAMGSLMLDEALAEGEYRSITEEELLLACQTLP